MMVGWLLAILTAVLSEDLSELPVQPVDPSSAAIIAPEVDGWACPGHTLQACLPDRAGLAAGARVTLWPAKGRIHFPLFLAPEHLPVSNWALDVRAAGTAQVCVFWPRLDRWQKDCGESRSGLGVVQRFTIPQEMDWTRPVTVAFDGTLLAPPVFKLGPRTPLERHERRIELAFGIYYGVVVAIAILSTVAFATQRYPTYLWYLGLLTTCLGALAGYSGRGLGFLDLLPGQWGVKVPLVMTFGLVISLIGFCLQYLDLAQSRLASWRRQAWGLVVLATVGALGTVIFGERMFVPAALMATIGGVFVVGLATSAALRGSRRGRYFLASSTLFVVGLLMVAAHALLSEYRGFPYSIGLTAIGAVVMPVVLVTGMYRSYRQLAMDRDQARNELMATQRLAILRAHYCKVTGLPRRTKLAEMFHALATRTDGDICIGVYLINIDDLAEIRQKHGRAVLEDVIARIAQRLRDGLDDDQLLGRLEDWELVVAIPAASHGEGFRERLYNAAENITSCLDAPMQVDGRSIRLSVSIGLAVWPMHGRGFDDLIRHCDSALYDAQSEGGNRIKVYSESAFLERTNRWDRLSDLRRALEQDSLEIHYHPIHDARSARIRGFEALLRWRREDGTLLLPGEFIPLAEDSDLIVDFGYWSLAAVVEDLKWFRAQGWDDFFVSLNVSPLQLVGNGFITQMRRLLERSGLGGDRLHLEITEDRLVDNWERTRTVLNRTKADGIRVYVDDFGVGYSSLSYLRELPVHGIKIDRSFVRNIGRTQQDETLLAAVLQLARTLNLDIIAEGVESDHQQVFLIDAGCRMLQGHLFSLPMPRDEMLEYLRASGVHGATGRDARGSG